jgi:hypothetical protein
MPHLPQLRRIGRRRLQRRWAALCGDKQQGHRRPGFAEEVPVSPKTLPDDKKVERWKDMWFADVSIDGDLSK